MNPLDISRIFGVLRMNCLTRVFPVSSFFQHAEHFGERAIRLLAREDS